MLKLKSALLSSVLVLAMTSPLLAQWPTVAEQVGKSIVAVGDEERVFCTGFVINDRAKGKEGEDVDYVLTANHCDAPKLFADGVPAKVVYKETKKDLLVLEVPDTERPALKLAKENPKIGDAVASYGYGFALERPMFRTTHIADDKTYIPEDGIGGPLMVVDAVFVGGQSGGPVVNEKGEVVMIVQLGGSGVGLGVGAEVIRDKTKKFWAKDTPKP